MSSGKKLEINAATSPKDWYLALNCNFVFEFKMSNWEHFQPHMSSVLNLISVCCNHAVGMKDPYHSLK